MKCLRVMPGLGAGALILLGTAVLAAGGDPATGAAVPSDSPSDAVIVFSIEVPPSTPTDAGIWIAGDRQELGAWNGHGIQAEQVGPLEYRVSQAFPVGTVLQFKVTRGSWDTVEKGPSGEEIGNRVFRVNGPEGTRVVVANWRDQVDAPGLTSTLTGDVRVHTGFASDFVSTRDVLVYLPAGYGDDPEGTYPVLYMHDGQNLFDRATSFLGIEWEVDETAERLIQAGRIEPLIVVGVYNSGTGRVYDYTPGRHRDGIGADTASRTGLEQEPAGGADEYGRFLVEELKPFIDGTYRTRPGRESTGIAGSSLGGLVSLYLGLELDDQFGRIGVVSPSVWWADGEILSYVGEEGHRDVQIWLDMGTAESPDAIQQGRALRDALTSEGWTLGDDLQYLEVEGAQHNEAAWADRIDEILEFLYPRH